jgi:hypothetical protein
MTVVLPTARKLGNIRRTNMNYVSCLKLAGAEVLVDRYFGSYQGDCFAKVSYGGTIGWIQDSYGSCAGCDALEALDSEYPDGCKDRYKPDHDSENCEACEAALEERNDQFLQYGQRLLEDILTQKEAEATMEKNAAWSLDDAEALEWLRENAIKETNNAQGT